MNRPLHGILTNPYDVSPPPVTRGLGNTDPHSESEGATHGLVVVVKVEEGGGQVAAVVRRVRLARTRPENRVLRLKRN